jgi:hypothetical protein
VLLAPLGDHLKYDLLKAHVIVQPDITFDLLIAIGTYGPLSARFHFRPFNGLCCMWAYFWAEVTFGLLKACSLRGYILAQPDYWPIKGL